MKQRARERESLRGQEVRAGEGKEKEKKHLPLLISLRYAITVPPIVLLLPVFLVQSLERFGL